MGPSGKVLISKHIHCYLFLLFIPVYNGDMGLEDGQPVALEAVSMKVGTYGQEAGTES